jgi:hypothetical protein
MDKLTVHRIVQESYQVIAGVLRLKPLFKGDQSTVSQETRSISLMMLMLGVECDVAMIVVQRDHSLDRISQEREVARRLRAKLMKSVVNAMSKKDLHALGANAMLDKLPAG